MRNKSIALVLFLIGTLSGARADNLRIAVYGDMPYTAEDRAFLKGPGSRAIVQDPTIAFVMAVGDLGRPDDACSNEWQLAQRRMWDEDFRKPVFLTPGDNDWTDCDRKQLPNPVSELGRLDAIRRIHFAAPPPMIQPEWRYRTQPGQPENATWVVRGIRFATIHVVGTMNGRTEINLDRRSLALALADARDVANAAWLADSFAAAHVGQEKAVVIAMQVDPFDPSYVDNGKPVPPGSLARCLQSDAMAPTCRALAEEVRRFAGPVLVVHGDSKQACLEPVRLEGDGRAFWRLNVWGDFTKPADIAILDIDPAVPDTPFRVTGLVEGHAMPSLCQY